MTYKIAHGDLAIAKDEMGLLFFSFGFTPIQFEFAQLDSMPSEICQSKKWKDGFLGYRYLIKNLNEITIEPYEAPCKEK